MRTYYKKKIIHNYYIKSEQYLVVVFLTKSKLTRHLCHRFQIQYAFSSLYQFVNWRFCVYAQAHTRTFLFISRALLMHV